MTLQRTDGTQDMHARQQVVSTRARRLWNWVVAWGAAACLNVAIAAGDPPALLVGVGTHFANNGAMIPEIMQSIIGTGVNSMRDDAYWKRVETRKGEYSIPPHWDAYVNRAFQAGIEPLLVLTYGNDFYDGGDKPVSPAAVAAFVRYSEAVVRHFKGRVRYYEIWNEWESKIGKTTPGRASDYVALLTAVVPAIKAIDRDAVILSSGVYAPAIRNGYLDELVALGMVRHVDGVSIHPYVMAQTGAERTPEAWARWVAEIHGRVSAGSQGRPVALYVTEIGWPTHMTRAGEVARDAVPPTQAAQYLARMFLIARTMPYVKGVWWYDFKDDGWDAHDKEHNFGLVRPNLSPKPAYHSLAEIAQIAVRDRLAGRERTADQQVWALRFEDPQGTDIFTVWSEQGKRAATLSCRGKPGTSVQYREVRAVADAREPTHAVCPVDIEIGEMPVVVRAPRGGIAVR